MKRRRRAGNSVLEFTLVGIPMIFVLISIFEVSRLLWSYHTVTAAVAEAARFAIVHGKNCGRPPNNCAVTAGDVARRLQASALGLAPAAMDVALVSPAGTIACSLPECLTRNTIWPPAPANEPGTEIEISATYTVVSMISMFWPGAGGGGPFGRVPLRATAREAIQF